jgi:hypothetical protein
MKKIIKAYAVMTNKGNLIEELRAGKEHDGSYLIAPTKKEAKLLLKEQEPPENWIVHLVKIIIED